MSQMIKEDIRRFLGVEAVDVGVELDGKELDEMTEKYRDELLKNIRKDMLDRKVKKEIETFMGDKDGRYDYVMFNNSEEAFEQLYELNINELMMLISDYKISKDTVNKDMTLKEILLKDNANLMKLSDGRYILDIRV